MVNPTVKKYFNKIGFSANTLQVLSDMVTGSLGENATEDEINEKCKEMEPLAKSFQSEMDSKVAAARKGTEKKSGEEGTEGLENPAGTPKQNSALEESILKLQQTVENLQKERISGDLGAAVRTKLKETLKMTDKEIESVMYGRTFENAEQVEEFVTKQEELYQDITKERIEHQAGSGFVPMISQGNVNKAAIENDIKEFNEKY